MSDTVTTLLIVGNNRTILGENLWYLSTLPQAENILVMILTDEKIYSPDLKTELLHTYQYNRYLNGYYQHINDTCSLSFLEVSSHECQEHLARFQSVQHLIITPESCERDADNPELFDISLSTPHSQMLSLLETLNIKADEKVLAENSRAVTHQILSLPSTFKLVQRCSKQWLALHSESCASAWYSALGGLFRCLQDMQLWQQRLMIEHRSLLDAAITRLHREPEHWGSHLVLLLHKRVYRWPLNHLAETHWYRSAQTYYQSTKGKHLTLLPPVSDYTVTIAVITYNRVRMLERIVNELLTQGYTDWRILIYNHGSTDGTTEYCNTLQQTYPEKVKTIHKAANAGPDAVGNIYQELLHAVTTELMVYLSDDDWLMSQHLEKTVGFLKERPWLGMVTGAYAAVNQTGALAFQYGPFYEADQVCDTQAELQHALLAGVCPQGCIYRKDLLKEFVTDDVLWYQDGYIYAYWDYLVTTKLLSHFEVGYLTQVLTGFTVSTSTAFHAWDFSHAFLCLMEGLCSDYNSLFGQSSYPQMIINNFFKNVIDKRLIADFRAILGQAQTIEQLDALLPQKERRWEEYIRVKHRMFFQTSQTAPVLLNVE